MALPYVSPGEPILAEDQNSLIFQVNQNTEAIRLGGGGDVQELVDATVTTHVNDLTPHPAYDDLPSLSLLFENGLV